MNLQIHVSLSFEVVGVGRVVIHLSIITRLTWMLEVVTLAMMVMITEPMY